MSNMLTGIERQLILEYLATETPPITFISEQKEDVPIIFPEGTISFSNTKGSITLAATRLLPASPIEGHIQFYYRKLGLCFSTTITQNGPMGASFPIPERIERISGFTEETTPVKGKVFYSFQNIKPCASCVSTHDYQLYNPFVWRELPDSDDFRKKLIALLKSFNFHICRTPATFTKTLAATQKILYIINGKLPQRQPFNSDVCLLSAELPIALAHKGLSGLFIPLDASAQTCAVSTEIIKNDAELDRLLSHFCGCKYLAQHQPLPDVQGRIEPLSIIYLSSYGFVLGGQKNQSLSLLKDGDTFQILLEEESPIGSRLIQSTIKITEHIIGDDDKQCIFCAFTEIQEEDKRFLFERFNGKKYK